MVYVDGDDVPPSEQTLPLMPNSAGVRISLDPDYCYALNRDDTPAMITWRMAQSIKERRPFTTSRCDLSLQIYVKVLTYDDLVKRKGPATTAEKLNLIDAVFRLNYDVDGQLAILDAAHAQGKLEMLDPKYHSKAYFALVHGQRLPILAVFPPMDFVMQDEEEWGHALYNLVPCRQFDVLMAIFPRVPPKYREWFTAELQHLRKEDARADNLLERLQFNTLL